MNVTTKLIAAWALCSSILFSICGCRESANAGADALPAREPIHADQPHAMAAKQFRQARAPAAAEQSTDWPQLFGPERTSAVESQIVDPLWDSQGPREVWSTEVGTGYGSPVIAAGRVVFNHRVGDEEIVQCVDALEGSEFWEHRYPTTFECNYEYSNGPYSTPVISGNDVFALGSQGQLFCLDLQSGDPRWARDLHEEYGIEDGDFAVGTTPGIHDDRLIINLGAADGNAGIVAVDRHSGRTIWESTDHAAAYCSPFFATIHDQPFVFIVTQIGLVSLHPETGQVDWMIEHRCRAPMSYNSVSPLVRDDMVLVVTGPGPGALCVRVKPDRSYQTLWKDRRVIDCQFNTLLLRGDNVFAFTAAGQGGAEFRCVDIRTGQLKWKYHSLLRRGQGLIAGNAIVLLGERGHLASLLVSDHSPQLLAFTEQPLMSEPCYCAPAYANGLLYLKDEQRIACFDLGHDRGRDD